MAFGYTLLDPLVVLLGTGLAIYFLGNRPVRLMAWLPAMLMLYFFIPLLTLLTLFQTVPSLLAGRVMLKGKVKAAGPAQPVLLLVFFILIISASYAIFLGSDMTRAIIRTVYYLGIFGVFLFSYEMTRHKEGYEPFLQGLVVLGIVLAVYAIYQIFAASTGLPFRGILRGTGGAQAAFEGGFFRVNSLASEPKRLAYVLFLSAMACIALARMRGPRQSQRLRWAAAGIFVVSILTFAGSYFIAIGLFCFCALFLYPSRAMMYGLGAAAIAVGVSVAIPDLGILDALQDGYERRMAEIEIGLDGTVVYRQEFFAWDYLANNPLSYLTGVGLGQYFSELNQAYGVGAGYDEQGGLAPLNSNFLELVFDLGVISAALVYGGLLLLIVRLRRTGETFLCLSLLFLALQSLTIINLLYISLFAGVAMGRLVLRQKGAVQSNRLTIVHRGNGITTR